MLIVNPISGHASGTGLSDKLVEHLVSHGFDVDLRFTRGAFDATVYARQAVAEGYDGVLACGGDGTINETARALIDTVVPLGILPNGSGNGLARHMNIPLDPLDAVDVIAARKIKMCDYGAANNSPFFCTFGVGFDAAVSDRFAASGARGKFTYVKSALQEFISYKPETYRISADGEEIDDKAIIVAVCNANQYGNNAYIAPGASIKDGLLDLVIVRDMDKVNTVIAGVEMLAGTLDDNSHIVRRKVRRVTIERSNEGPAQLDGEPFHTGRTIDIECRQAGLLLFTNEKKTAFRPIVTPVQAMMHDIEHTIRNLFH